VALLVEAIAACRACEQHGLLPRSNPIATPSSGEARVLLVGQAPGAITDQKGYPFAGPAGRELERWLDRAGFPHGYFREHIWLSSLTRCYPGKAPSGNGDRQPSPAEVALCRPFLEREIAKLDPKLILLVGKMAVDAFLGKQPLVATVGRVFDAGGRPVLPLPHASGVSRWLNDASNRALLEQALAELSRLRIELRL
jgi:uracil-DNA glycosylase